MGGLSRDEKMGLVRAGIIRDELLSHFPKGTISAFPFYEGETDKDGKLISWETIKLNDMTLYQRK